MPDAAGTDGGGGSGNEPVASAQQAQQLACTQSNLVLYQDLVHVDLPGNHFGFHRVDEWFCWVRSMPGDGAHRPRAEVKPNTTWWDASPTIISDGHGNNNYAPPFDAACAPLSCFFSNGGSADRKWVSEVMGAEAAGSPLPAGCDTQTEPTWWGDAANVLEGLRNKPVSTTFDYARVTQNAVFNVSSTVSIRDCHWTDGFVPRDVFAASLFVGTPGGTHSPWFRGPNSTRGTAAAAGEYVSKSWDPTITNVNMAYVDEGICYFSYLAGDFHTVNDRARIWTIPFSGRQRWRLTTEKASNNDSTSGIRAHARCYLYDQNQ
jgi:hypothetical protein